MYKISTKKNYMVSSIQACVPPKRIVLKNSLLIFFAILLVFSSIGNFKDSEIFYKNVPGISMRIRGVVSLPSKPLAELVQSDLFEGKTGIISGIRYREILEEIARARRFQYMSRDLSQFVGILTVPGYVFYSEKVLQKNRQIDFCSFLQQIIRYIHNQDGEKEGDSPVHI